MESCAAPSISTAEQCRLVSLSEAFADRARWPRRPAASDPFDLHWYILVVSPFCEKAVAQRLTRAFDPLWSPPTDAPWKGMTSADGIVTFAPIYRRRRKVGPRRETVDHILFPRYLFVGFESEPPWLYVRNVLGVQGVLGIDGKPAELPAETVGGLMFRCSTGQLDPPLPPTPQRGMSVVATHGEFRGFEGSVTRVRKQTDQVDVLFELFSKMPVTLSLDDVQSISYAYHRMTG